MAVTGGKSIKNANIWRLNNMLLNSQQIVEEIKKEIKICIETNENENTITQTYDIIKRSSKREVHSNSSLPQETRETSNKQPNFTPKATR